MAKAKLVKRSDGTVWPTNIRRNWGYWDGVADASRGRYAAWVKHTIYRNKHPFDQAYGEGYWTGRYGEEAPKGAII